MYLALPSAEGDCVSHRWDGLAVMTVGWVYLQQTRAHIGIRHDPELPKMFSKETVTVEYEELIPLSLTPRLGSSVLMNQKRSGQSLPALWRGPEHQI